MENSSGDLKGWRRVDVVQQLEVLNQRQRNVPTADDRRLAEQIALCEAFLHDMDVHSEMPATPGKGAEDEDRAGPEAPGLP